MRTKDRWAGAVAFSAVMLAASVYSMASPVGVYVNDHFSSPTLDPTVWTTNGGTYNIDPTGQLTMTADMWLASIATVSPGAGQTVTASLTNLYTDASSKYQQWGLAQSPAQLGTNSILLFQDHVTLNQTVMQIIANGVTQYCVLSRLPNAQIAGQFALTWTPNRVTLDQNTTGTWVNIFDSNTDAPAGGGAWALPTVNMGLFAFSYLNGNLQYQRNAYLAVTAVPEPATMLLIGVGGVVGLLRRQRRHLEA